MALTVPNFCVVLCIVCFVYCVLFVCICVLYYCHRVAAQLQKTNISIYNGRLFYISLLNSELGPSHCPVLDG
jgi:hypothetical protein